MSARQRRWLAALHEEDGMVTAFVVVNARSFGMRPFDLALWAGPIAVLAAGLTIWRRYYARRFTGNDVPGGTTRVQ